MPRNGSGTYVQPAGTAGVDGQIIYATPYNNLIADIGNEITNSLPTNGSKGMSANMPMNSNRILLLADPVNPQDAATKNYVDTAISSSGTVFVGGTTTGTASAQILASTVPSNFTLAAGNSLKLKLGFTLTGATTLTITTPALGPIPIKKYGPAGALDPAGGEAVAGQEIELLSDGTNLMLVTAISTVGKPVSISANTTYGLSDLGKFIEMTGGTAFVTTIPNAPATGGSFRFYSASTVVQSVSVASGSFGGPGGSGTSTLPIQPGEFVEVNSDGTSWIVTVRYFASAGIWAPGTIYGLALSRATATTVGIATGSCVNEDGSAGRNMTLGSAITKGLGTWAAGSGNGGLDTGTITTNAWYNVHLIRKDSDGSLDALLSFSWNAPTMPPGYTARRRIGAFKTDGSSQIVPFTQVGDVFLWTTSVTDASAAITVTTGQLVTLSVPPGVSVQADVMFRTVNASVFVQTYAYSPFVTAETSNSTGNPLFTAIASSSVQSSIPQRLKLLTNTSGQIGFINNNTSSTTVYIVTYGWIDTRGKN